MTIFLRSPFHVGFQVVSIVFACSIVGCRDNDSPESDSGKGGSSTATGGRGDAAGDPMSGGGDPASGGGERDPGTGTSGGSHTGGRASADPETDEPDGDATTGGSDSSGAGGASTGGMDPSDGVPPGSGSSSAGEESICSDEAGAPVSYDYSVGLLGEYAYELSTNCDIGGYLAPLVRADPEQLTQVDEFVVAATAWYRSEILSCSGESSPLGKDSYGLLPASQSEALSEADFDASLALFMSVIDRHDDQPDFVSAPKKEKINKRIKAVKAKAIKDPAAGLTKPLEGECAPGG